MNKIIKAVYEPKDKNADYDFGNIDSDYSATERYFKYKDKPYLPFTGEIHFSRCDSASWDVELAKIRAQGLDGVSVYVFWNHHETSRGKFDFGGNKDINAFLGLCRKHNLTVVLRIGPWCHGEARYGGFPDYLRYVPAKRTSSPLYLRCVKRFWERLYCEVKEYCDGSTVIGIQLENEYSGSISHIEDLRKIAEDIGFKTPYFTMTVWPTNTPSKRFLPMCGGYPEAPWTQHKRKLEPNGRFMITGGRTEAEIGEDLIKIKKKKADFSMYPYAGCEVGTGNQVTQHRRPVISDKDGYGVAFAKIASGMNWMGYYMYRGGRNPEGKPMQESRRTLYPNNYPVIDYDFQAPISKDGKIRKHADRLRLIHIFTKYWDDKFSRTQAFFDSGSDLPYFSVRADEEKGYVFISNYERGAESKESCLAVCVEINGNEVNINDLKVPCQSMFFFPVGCRIGGEKYDYITAQPIAMLNAQDGLHAYFMKPDGVDTRISINSAESVADNLFISDRGNGKTFLHFLDEKEALKIYIINNKLLLSDGALYENNGKIYAELCNCGKVVYNNRVVAEYIDDKPTGNVIGLTAIKCKRTKYDYYLYSGGNKACYALTVNGNGDEIDSDTEVTLEFKGMNLQVYHGDTLIDDYFNTDGNYVFRLGRIGNRLARNKALLIKTAAKTDFGIGNPYNEINIKTGITDLSVASVKIIKTVEIRL